MPEGEVWGGIGLELDFPLQAPIEQTRVRLASQLMYDLIVEAVSILIPLSFIVAYIRSRGILTEFVTIPGNQYHLKGH
ncbi:MAG: hypothetical protein KDD22_06760 [Bdellovibrionales bacterium]|nr:hypothetical protein [Bdellovibrionales bacterium]